MLRSCRWKADKSGTFQHRAFLHHESAWRREEDGEREIETVVMQGFDRGLRHEVD